MPYDFDVAACAVCPVVRQCVEDRRNNPVRGRQTVFRVMQNNGLQCTFDSFVPGYGGPQLSYAEHLARWSANIAQAKEHLFPEEADLTHSQLAKTEGDVLELLLAASLWNMAADWNAFMNTGRWQSPMAAPDAVPCESRKVAIVTLPRGYSAMRLFDDDARRKIEYFNHALGLTGMELRLSTPDIVGLRLPDPLPPECDVFCERLPNLAEPNRLLLERAFRALEGRISGHGFLFSIAVKKSVRSDRLYQPLFEANVLKYLVQEVLRGAALKFHVYVMNTEGAAVAQHYRAASLFSLLRGGQAERAVDRLVVLKTPQEALDAVLSDLATFPM